MGDQSDCEVYSRLSSKENWGEPNVLNVWTHVTSDFTGPLEQKLGARGHWALLELNPEY